MKYLIGTFPSGSGARGPVLGYLVPYQMVEVDRVRCLARRWRYIPILPHWRLFESSQGFPVELLPILSYAGWQLISDPNWARWVVVFGKCTLKMVCFVLQDAYDLLTLWYMSPVECTCAEKLDLARGLDSLSNEREFRSLFSVI